MNFRFINNRSHGYDMTEGNIANQLLSFTMPLFVGYILQQLYNTVDTWVVGNYVSNEAFSAVGTIGPVTNMLVGLFLGLSNGTSVVIAQYYGAQKPDKVQETVHTAILMTLILSVIFTFLGLWLIPYVLKLMNTPAEVYPQSQTYLTIYWIGITGTLLYNVGSGILQAIGDAIRPFYFLAIAAITNTVLDLVSVIVFHMGVAGVALATIIAQGISAVFVLVTLSRSDSCVKLRFKSLSINKDILAKIIKIGIPSGIQMAITSFSNIFVQSYINFFGADCMSGWTAYAKIDQFVLLPMQSLSLGITTFVGQNLGRGRIERAKEGIHTTLLMSIGVTISLMIPVLIFAPQLVAFFNKKPEVIAYGTTMLRFISPFYLLCCINQIYTGSLRGAGDSRAPMIIMLCSFVVFRQCYLYIMAHYISNTVLPIIMGYPAGWLVCSVSTLLYYRHAKWLNHRIVVN